MPKTRPLPGQPNTAFDWAMYSDATLAGLAVLTPIPVLDWLLEEFFRRRIPAAVARNRGIYLHPSVSRILNHSKEDCLTSCLMLPVRGAWNLAKSLSRKLFYVLSVKEASDKVSLYWHQAYLFDYMLASGHLESEASAEAARQAMEVAIRQAPVSPLNRLAPDGCCVRCCAPGRGRKMSNCARSGSSCSRAGRSTRPTCERWPRLTTRPSWKSNPGRERKSLPNRSPGTLHGESTVSGVREMGGLVLRPSLQPLLRDHIARGRSSGHSLPEWYNFSKAAASSHRRSLYAVYAYPRPHQPR